MSRRTALTLAFIGLAALVVAATVLAACGGSDDLPDAVDVVTGRTVTTSPAEGVASGDPSSTTGATSAPDQPEPAIEAAGLEWRRAEMTAVGYDGMRITETVDGFFALGYKIDEGEITTWTSADGHEWKEASTDTEALEPGEYIMEVAATPSGHVATGGEAEWWWGGEGPVDRMWTSADGARWARRGFDLLDEAPPSPYLKGEGSITGVARGPTGLVMVSSAIWVPNDQAILDEIAPGTDVAEIGMFGLGGVGPDGETGFVYHDQQGNLIGSASLGDLGLPAGIVDTLGGPTVGVWHSPDGSSWTPYPEATEWRSEQRDHSLAAGPNGYLIDSGDMLYLSLDAEVWIELPAESAFGIPTEIFEGHVTSWGGGWAAIVEAGMVPREGPVEGTDYFTEQRAVLTSADGTAWTESVVPTSMLFSEERASLDSLFGGEFGLLASVSPDLESWDPSRGLFEAELWWSSDAITWDPIHVGRIFGSDRIVWDVAISTDRVVVLVADWTGWQDEAEEGTPAPLELWVASAP